MAAMYRLCVFVVMILEVATQCKDNKYCYECIRTPTCAWCKQQKFEKDDESPKDRCNTPDQLEAEKCPKEDIVFPENTQNIIEEKELSVVDPQESKNVVQIKPQRVSLKLRVQEEHTVEILYARAKDLPVDLYYLMDFSKSMEEDKNSVANLGDSIIKTMSDLTSEFRLGFGSFVDKVIRPYVNTHPKNLNNPGDKYARPFGFKNNMKLTNAPDAAEKFKKTMKTEKTAGNQDAPEAGFDALMQTMVCSSDIGWSNHTQRLIVYSSDNSFHYAGDGKLGGIVAPNDGLCHLQDGTVYTHAEILDYPSVSQINKKAIATNTRIIFAVTEEQKEVYKILQNSVKGSSLGVLEKDSSNVVQLITNEYKRIRGSVELQASTSSDQVQVELFSNCKDKTEEGLDKTSECGGLTQDQQVKFFCKIKVLSAPKDPSQYTNQQIQINVVGEGDKVLIDLDIVGDCECEHEGNPGYIPEAKECESHGSLECGTCVCQPGYSGENCECSKDATNSTNIDINNCKSPGSNVICSNQGNCICGRCECALADSHGNKFRGKYCECDDYSCKRQEGQLCSGSERGTCKCGKCECKEGWEGEACQCPVSNDVCVLPGQNVTCSGRGECECGVCKCNEAINGRYHGKFCEEEPALAGRCKEILPCAQCKAFSNGKLSEEECEDKTICNYDISVEENVKEADDEVKCTFKDADHEECRIRFVYGFHNGTKGTVVKVRVDEEQDCATEANLLFIVVGLISGIVLLGLFMICIWRIYIWNYDRKEYAKWKREKDSARFPEGENPLYRPATTTVTNPTYSQ